MSAETVQMEKFQMMERGSATLAKSASTRPGRNLLMEMTKCHARFVRKVGWQSTPPQQTVLHALLLDSSPRMAKVFALYVPTGVGPEMQLVAQNASHAIEVKSSQVNAVKRASLVPIHLSLEKVFSDVTHAQMARPAQEAVQIVLYPLKKSFRSIEATG